MGPLPSRMYTPAARAAAGLLFAPLGVLGVAFYALWAFRTWTEPGHVTDFLAFHTWAAMLRAIPHAAGLYDEPRVRAFLVARHPVIEDHYPFAYPPSFLLVLWPLGGLAGPLGALVWGLAGLAIYVVALAEPPWRRAITIALLLLPATALTVGQGRDGLIFAGFMGGACRLLPRRPVWAGVLFGLLACKPQFGVLVPLALLSARQGRAFAAAAVTVLGSVIASAWAFGWSLWLRWPVALMTLSRIVGQDCRLDPLMPTVTGNLRLLHLAPAAILIAQVGAAALAALCVWAAWRREPGRDAAAVLMVGTFLATPYAFSYDLPILDAGLLAFLLERIARGEQLMATECAAGGLALVLPIVMMADRLSLPVSLPPLVSVFALVVRRVRRNTLASRA